MLQSFLIPKVIADNPSWRNAVNRAGEWIVQTLGQWSTNKHFAWGLRPEPDGEPRFDLRMEAEDCAVSSRFDYFELTNEKLLKDRIMKMWDDLIGQVIHVQVEDLKRLRDEWKEAAVASQD